MASYHAHINTLVCLHDILSDVQYGFLHGMFPGKGQCLYKRLFVHVHASVSVTFFFFFKLPLTLIHYKYRIHNTIDIWGKNNNNITH